MMLNTPTLKLVLAAGVATASITVPTVTEAQTAASVAEAAAKAEAKNQVSNYIDLSGSVGFSTNGRLSPSGGGSGAAGIGRVSAYAAHTVVSNRDQISLTAYAENQSYTKGGGSTQSFETQGSIRHSVNPRLDIYGSAGLSGDTGGQLYNRFVSVPYAPIALDPNNPLPSTGIIDPAFVSLNRRQYRLYGNGGFSHKFSARDFVNASAGYTKVFYKGSGANLDYDTINGSVGWDRQFTERTSGGLRLGVSRSDYGNRGHSTVFNPAVTARTQLSEGWDANGAIGVSLVRQTTSFGRSNSTDLSLDASLCRTLVTQSFCGRVSRSAQTSIGQGLVNATTAGLTYFRRINAKDTLQAGASVARSSGGNVPLLSTTTTYYTANASYNRKISPRLSTGVEGGVRKVDQRGSGTPVDANAVIFLRYRLGDLL